jgi:biotin-(acetyl-CoA carboxylase) ligase
VGCRDKTPNEDRNEGRKVAAALIEARPPDWAVIGIGINVGIEPDEFADDLRWPATSVGHGVTVEAMLAELNRGLGRWVTVPAGQVRDAYAERDALEGRRVAWEGGPPGSESGRGTARGIDEVGNLAVETDAGERLAIGAGDVHLTLD